MVCLLTIFITSQHFPGSYWPEDIISEILEAGATGPHVTAILDKAHKLSSSKVITATNSQSLPERALVWALESSIRKLSQDQSESNETNLGKGCPRLSYLLVYFKRFLYL